MERYRPALVGLLGAFGLLAVYFLVLILAESAEHALEQLAQLGFWITLLAAGFGLQLGLYAFVRGRLRRRRATAEVAATGGLSTGAMIACCAHHLVDVLPVLGLTAAAIFLTRYQLGFLVLGVGANLLGVVVMLGIIQRHGLYQPGGWLRGLFSFDMRRLRNLTAVLASVAVAVTFLLVSEQAGAAGSSRRGSLAVRPEPLAQGGAGSGVADAVSQEGVAAARTLEAQVDGRNFVSVAVQPVEFRRDGPVTFAVSLNTHQGDLGFDVAEIAFLEDDLGNRYLPTGWDGSPPGGHHRRGTLRFPSLAPDAGLVRLTLRNIYQIPERVFEWKL